jgi:hypothetical protein
MMEIRMNTIVRAFTASLATLSCLVAQAADGVAFITNLKGDVSVDGTPRPLLMSELSRGQKIVVAKEGQLAVMYIQSGREYVLRGPGDYTIGEREIASGSGVSPAARETTWRASSEVLVKVAQTSSASIRMRSMAPTKSESRAKLDFPTQGAVSTLQPTLRWTMPDANAPADVAIAVAGREEKPLAKARVQATSHRFALKLKPDMEYSWTVSVAGSEIGNARFKTLSTAMLQNAEKRRPGEKAEFSDRLLYALLLQEIGAVQEAHEAWGRLARERADLPELAGLAR